MTAKKDAAPVFDVPMTFRDFPGEVPASEPVQIAFPISEPVIEPAKPAVKKEN